MDVVALPRRQREHLRRCATYHRCAGGVGATSVTGRLLQQLSVIAGTATSASTAIRIMSRSVAPSAVGAAAINRGASGSQPARGEMDPRVNIGPDIKGHRVAFPAGFLCSSAIWAAASSNRPITASRFAWCAATKSWAVVGSLARASAKAFSRRRKARPAYPPT